MKGRCGADESSRMQSKGACSSKGGCERLSIDRTHTARTSRQVTTFSSFFVLGLTYFIGSPWWFKTLMSF